MVADDRDPVVAARSAKRDRPLRLLLDIAELIGIGEISPVAVSVAKRPGKGL